MNPDQVTKQEILRLTSTKWKRINMLRRWEYLCEMRAAGKTWKEMGKVIDRHWTTAQRLWERAWIERQKHACVCRLCGSKRFKIKTYGRYLRPLDDKMFHWKRRREGIVFGGICEDCKQVSWSRAFALNSYRLLNKTYVPVDMPDASEIYRKA